MGLALGRRDCSYLILRKEDVSFKTQVNWLGFPWVSASWHELPWREQGHPSWSPSRLGPSFWFCCFLPVFLLHSKCLKNGNCLSAFLAITQGSTWERRSSCDWWKVRLLFSLQQMENMAESTTGIWAVLFTSKGTCSALNQGRRRAQGHYLLLVHPWQTRCLVFYSIRWDTDVNLESLNDSWRWYL